MSTSPSISWHALYVASRHERIIGKQLALYGFESFVPVQKQVHQWADRKKCIDVVLFPGYVFLSMGSAKERHNVFNVPNVLGFVKFGGQIATLSEREVALIKQIGQSEHPVVPCTPSLVPGDEVEITAGPLRNLHGRVLALNGTAHVQLSVPSLQWFAQVMVGRGDLKKVQ